MKRILFLIILLTAATTVVRAQWFDLSENQGRCGAGAHAGLAGWNTTYSRFGWGAHLQIYGVYLDYMIGQPEHRYYTPYAGEGRTQYQDSEVFLANAGYQLPVLPWLRLMPLVGYCQTNEGITDISKIHEDYSDEAVVDSYHPYKVTLGTRRHRLNAGVGLFVQPCRWFEVYAVGSLHALYGGISISLDAFAEKRTTPTVPIP